MNLNRKFNPMSPKNNTVRMLGVSACIVACTIMFGCTNNQALSFKDPDANILFLHHSTGKRVWLGGADSKNPKAVQLMQAYTEKNGKKYAFSEQYFPTKESYGWKNYPYDYYNIWVKNAGDEKYKDQPTLEILTKDYNVIIFKHCFPVSNVLEDTGKPDIDSEEKRLENYKLQYNALKDKLKSFPNTKFIVWTSAALTEASTSKEKGERSQEFVKWVKEKWDEDGDNIFLFDFWTLETEGGLYLKDKYAAGKTDSHPNDDLSKKVSELFVARIIDVIENNGQKTTLTGEKK